MPQLKPETISMTGLNLFQHLCNLARLATSAYDGGSNSEVSLDSVSCFSSLWHMWILSLKAKIGNHQKVIPVACISLCSLSYFIITELYPLLSLKNSFVTFTCLMKKSQMTFWYSYLTMTKNVL